MLVASVGALLGQVLRKIGSPTLVPDQELLQLYNQKRSEAAFEELVHRHAALVWGVCHRMLTHQQDAEDAFQATFVVLAKKARSIHRPERLGHWLYGVACYAARNVRKSRQRRKVREQSWGEWLEVPDHRHALWNAVSPVVDDELVRLPGKYRLPLVLCCVEGMTHQEAARVLSWPVGTVAGRVSRGREMLRQRLQQRGVLVAPAILAGFLSREAMAGSFPAPMVQACLNTVFSHSTVSLAGSSLAPAVSTAVAGAMKQLVLSRFAAMAWTLLVVVVLSAGIMLGWRILASNQGETTAVVEPEATPLPVADHRYVRLPADPHAVVLRWNQSDLLQDRPCWDLTIHADGVMLAELRQEPWLMPIRYEGMLTPQEVQQLVQAAVHDQKFPTIDKDKTWNQLQQEYEFEGDMRSPGDTLVTEIQLRTADYDHSVQWYQLSSTEAWFHEVKAVKQLSDLQRLLKNKVLVLQAGGKKAVEAVAGPLTAELRRTYPRLASFTAAELSYYTPGNEGTPPRWTFSHGSMFGNQQFFSATCEMSAEGRALLTQVTPGPGDKVPTMKRRASRESNPN